MASRIVNFSINELGLGAIEHECIRNTNYLRMYIDLITDELNEIHIADLEQDYWIVIGVEDLEMALNKVGLTITKKVEESDDDKDKK